MNRKAIFDAVRAMLKRGFTANEVAALDDAIDATAGVAPAPPPEAASKRRTSPKGVALIQSFESLKLTAYKDPGPTGLPITNGWGTTVDEDGGKITLGEVWTREKADRLFARDLAKFEAELDRLLGSAPTTQGQYDALVSFGYNIGMGEGGLKTSTLLRMHKAGEYAQAAGQFARWNKAGGRVLAGLTRRRKAEAELYAS
jgi:GH24 family phage-related lysozyme (muramidase)